MNNFNNNRLPITRQSICVSDIPEFFQYVDGGSKDNELEGYYRELAENNYNETFKRMLANK